MKAPSAYLPPSRWLPLLAVAALAVTWFTSPDLRLDARDIEPIAVKAQTVDVHRNDSKWFDAARAGRVDLLSALLEAGYPIDARTASGHTATMLAAYEEQSAALEYLLGRGANACLGDNNGDTALMGALYKGDLAVATRLMATPCSVDQANHDGETPLSFAVMFGRSDLIKPLIDRGANPMHRDGLGHTPYRVAQQQKNIQAMRALETLTPSGGSGAPGLPGDKALGRGSISDYARTRAADGTGEDHTQ